MGHRALKGAGSFQRVVPGIPWRSGASVGVRQVRDGDLSPCVVRRRGELSLWMVPDSPSRGGARGRGCGDSCSPAPPVPGGQRGHGVTDSPVGALGRKWVQEETRGKSTAKGQSHREDRKQEFFGISMSHKYCMGIIQMHFLKPVYLKSTCKGTFCSPFAESGNPTTRGGPVAAPTTQEPSGCWYLCVITAPVNTYTLHAIVCSPCLHPSTHP